VEGVCRPPDVSATTELAPGAAAELVLAGRQGAADVGAAPCGGAGIGWWVRPGQLCDVVDGRHRGEVGAIGVAGDARDQRPGEVEGGRGAGSEGEVDAVGRREG